MSHDELLEATERLSAGRTGVACRPAPPDPPWERIGAIGGFGLVAEDLDVHLSVYLFAQWGDGQEHAAALQAAAETGQREAIAAVNGALLFLGVALRGNDQAHFALNDLCSAFAGQE